jgi:hypothetical protein
MRCPRRTPADCVGIVLELVLWGAPLSAEGSGPRLPDVKPKRDVDLLEVELEERILCDRLDHSAHVASRHDPADQSPRRRVLSHLDRQGPNTQFVVRGARGRMDHTARVSAKVPPLGRRSGDCREQPSLGENRTERMETRTTISTHRGEITDREAWLTLRAEIVTTQCSNPEPEPCPDVSKLWGSNLEPGPRRHRSYSACGLVILQFFDGPRGEGGGAKSAGAQPPQSCLPT